MRRLIMIAALALGLGACQTISAIPTAVTIASTPVCAGQTVDEKLWYAAEAAYNVPAQAYIAARSRDLVPLALRKVIRPKLITMYDGLKAARLAYEACDAASLRSKITALEALRDQVLPLIPKG